MLNISRAGVLLAALILAACGADPSADAALEAEHAALATEVADARATATFAADSRAVTREYLATASTLAAQRQRQILLTLTSSGIDTSSAAQITPMATITSAAADAVATFAVSGAMPAGGVTRIPTTPQFRTAVPTNTSPAPTPTIDPNGPNFTNVQTAPSVGEDDCAVNPSAVFATETTEIYIVATANNVLPGMTLGSRWLKDGVELAVFTFQPDFAINGNCVWFFATSDDFLFEAGAYTVQLEIDARPAAPPLTFSISGAPPAPTPES